MSRPEHSPRLRSFVKEAPLERAAVVALMEEASARLAPASRVLDAGAGESPYRELFAHCEYTTADWSASVHPGARAADIIASLDSLPVEDASFEAVICTQVLEHVAEPARVLAELHRVLAPGGQLWLTVPFVGELHEEPWDFFRYTHHGLRHLCQRAGFVEVRTAPLGGYFTTMAQLARNAGLATGVDRQSPLGRRILAAALRLMGGRLAALDRLDTRRALPIGWSCHAIRGGG